MPQPPKRSGVHVAFLGSLAGILLAWDTVGAPKTITLEVDGAASSMSTRHTRSDGLLREAGLVAGISDALAPRADAAVSAGATVTLRRAVPVAVTYGGETQRFTTTAATVADALAQSGLVPVTDTMVSVAGVRRSTDTLLPRLGGAVVPALVSASPAGEVAEPSALVITVEPAATFFVHEARRTLEFRAHAATLGDALKQAGVALFPADLLVPDATQPLTHGLHAKIKRSTPFRVTADGRTVEARTQATTVADALKEQAVTLNAGDRVQPPLDTPLKGGIGIQVVRVNQRTVVEEEAIPFRTQYVADADMEIGTQRTAIVGAAGLQKREFQISYEDGREVGHRLALQRIEREPVHAEIRYGTKVIQHAITTPDGPIEYWRTLRVWATWYSPASAGKPRSSPSYGITATGLQARRGVIAVDPNVIPLGTRVYVPGYGVAVAGDTGGGVRGNVIDLAYGDDEVQDWVSRSLEIYVLGPGPSPSQIRPPSP